MDGIGARVRRVRREREISQQALAERAGIAFQTLNRIEKGRVTPKIETVATLAQALGVDLKWLAFGGDEKGGTDAV